MEQYFLDYSITDEVSCKTKWKITSLEVPYAVYFILQLFHFC
jgi:hypothetical protein